jgi:hypothetical protein
VGFFKKFFKILYYEVEIVKIYKKYFLLSLVWFIFALS